MYALLVASILSFFQLTLQEKPVVHQAPNRTIIDVAAGGNLLQLMNTSAALSLPVPPPRTDLLGKPWIVDVKNLGPNKVTITGIKGFNASLLVGQTVHIASNGTAYTLSH